MPAIVKIISVTDIVDIDIIAFVPVVCPVFRPRVNETEPITAILEPGISTDNQKRLTVDAEPVAPAKVAIKMIFRNAVAAVAAALLPCAVL